LGKPCGKSDSLARLGGHLTPILAIQAAQGRRHQTCDQALATKNLPGALAHGDIAVVSRRQAARPVRLPIRDADRQDSPPGGQGRLYQRRVEMQQMRPVSRRSLGEYGHMVARCQDAGDFLIDDPGVPAAASAQKYRIVASRQPADQGPMANLFLGNECSGQRSVDHVDIDPGNMIGDQQGTRLDVREIGFENDAENVEQGSRPTCLQSITVASTTPGEDDEHDQCPAQHEQGEAE